MDNLHKKISGYRDLSQREIDLMNEAKHIAEQVGELCKRIKYEDGIDQGWANEGQKDLQKGFMSLIRSIARPTTF